MSYQPYTTYLHPTDIYQQQLQQLQQQQQLQQHFQQQQLQLQQQAVYQNPYYNSSNNSQNSLINYSISQQLPQLQQQHIQQQQQPLQSSAVPSSHPYLQLQQHQHQQSLQNGHINNSEEYGQDYMNPDLNLQDYPYEDIYQPNDLRQDRAAAPSRTVYLGNVPNDITPKELLDHVRSGIIESMKILPSKNCAFISFLDESSALLFHSDLILKRLTIKQNDIRIGWGKHTQLQPVVLNAVNRYGATRNVYLGNLSPTTTEEELLQDLAEFGPIDTIKLIPEKKIAFIHFTSILTAIRVVQNLPINEKYQDKKIFYGKDRCAFITKTQQHNAAQYLGLNPNFEHLITNADREFISTALVQQSTAALAIATSAGGANNLGNRTVYLGNLHPDSTIEEICNVVRGGILQNIRLISERHVCFITFIDPIALLQFFAMSSLHGLIIHNRKIKIGWGKHSGPLSNALTLAVGNGASRNIYIGGLELPLEGSEELFRFASKLRKDFEEFGEIEQINFFVEKNCGFINFTNISNSIKAIDGIKYNKDYENLKINFGKDRCGNIPRQFQNNNNNNNNGINNGGERFGYSHNNQSNEQQSSSPSASPSPSPVSKKQSQQNDQKEGNSDDNSSKSNLENFINTENDEVETDNVNNDDADDINNEVEG